MITIVILVGYAVLFAFIGSQSSSSSLVLTGQAEQLRPALTTAAQRAGTDLTLTDAGPATAEETLRGDDAPDAVLEGGPGDYRLIGLDDVDTDLQNLVSTTVRQQAVDSALRSAGRDPVAVEQTATVAVSSVNPADPLRGQRIGVAFAVAFLLFISVQTYGSLVAQGVVEEKSSRVVEVLLASVRPAQLLTGKVIGMGATAFAQVIALVVTFLVVGEATGSDLLRGAAIGVVLVGALWMVLGYALHCTAFAAAGSLITRESDAANVTFPVALPMLISYALSFGVVFGASSNGLFDALSYIPPTAPIACTTLYAIGSAGLGHVLVSAVICAVTTVATARLAADVYERSILRTGARIKLRDALRAHA
jgi:ABC-2 type transport system permease protein